MMRPAKVFVEMKNPTMEKRGNAKKQFSILKGQNEKYYDLIYAITKIIHCHTLHLIFVKDGTQLLSNNLKSF
jgi:hypothetical protein